MERHNRYPDPNHPLDPLRDVACFALVGMLVGGDNIGAAAGTGVGICVVAYRLRQQRRQDMQGLDSGEEL